LSYTAEVNQRYYQLKKTTTWRLDKGFKIGVALLAVTAALFVFLPHDLKWLEVVSAILAVAMAIVLNVIPVGEWMTEYGEMCHSWNSLFIEIDRLKMRTRDIANEEAIPAHYEESLIDMNARQYELDQDHAADDALLVRCQEEVNNRMYGGDVRTYEQAVIENDKRAESFSGDVHG
jgi:hypothetical protein